MFNDSTFEFDDPRISVIEHDVNVVTKFTFNDVPVPHDQYIFDDRLHSTHYHYDEIALASGTVQMVKPTELILDQLWGSEPANAYDPTHAGTLDSWMRRRDAVVRQPDGITIKVRVPGATSAPNSACSYGPGNCVLGFEADFELFLKNALLSETLNGATSVVPGIAKLQCPPAPR